MACVSKGMIFLTGLSGSGKSTIAGILERKNPTWTVLDGDVLRRAYQDDLPSGVGGAAENTRRLILAARKCLETSDCVVCSFVAPVASLRKDVKTAMESEGFRFIEVFVKADIDSCRERDPKGLYKRHRDGENIRLAGLNESYDIPENPQVLCDTDCETDQECATKILQFASRYFQ